MMRSTSIVIVCLATLVASAGNVSAGIMTSPFEVDSFANVDASSFPITNPDDEDSKLLDALQQTFGMSCQSNPSVDNTPPVCVGIFDYPSVEDELCQWLVSHRHLVIPGLIPICLLKVPIEVV
ncbi:hypothetical protein Poly41_34100 [Novipirellula artificiosorum]|uniref:Uncharacterized protein n=1 Tax=Novipirellula artificiosorum TaxID=2528016 RepID=A0A5C6DNP4_9BACT|nr:hypothetical protein Poly41_34100 [Novipirellula artificiosorum]